MVGVPSSRGCLACRKQKKKCLFSDETKPCERCASIGIECLGLGVRRLKFQNENVETMTAMRKGPNLPQLLRASTIAHGDDVTLQIHSKQIPYSCEIESTLSSPLTRLCASYILSIDRGADISVQLPWNFGIYLELVPCRLGFNDALDEAASLLTEAYSCFRRGQQPGQNANCLRKYSRALVALKIVLDRPKQATEIDTVCAINMIMIFEIMAGFGRQGLLTHAGAAARIFKVRGMYQPNDEFEKLLSLSLRGPAVMQALLSPDAHFSDEEWTLLASTMIDGESPEEGSFRCLVIFTHLLHRAEALLQESVVSYQRYTTMRNLIFEVEELETQLAPQMHALREQFRHLSTEIRTVNNLAPLMSNQSSLSQQMRTYHAHIGRSYGFSMATKVLTNTLLQALKTRLAEFAVQGDSSICFTDRYPVTENTSLAEEICQLASEVQKYRPLGTIYMATVLRLTYAGVTSSLFNTTFGTATSPKLAKVCRGSTSSTKEQSSVLEKILTYLASYLSDPGKPNTTLDHAAHLESLDWLRRRINLEK